MAGKKKKKRSPRPDTSAPTASVQASKSWVTYVYPVIIAIIFLIAFQKVFDKKLDLNGDNFQYLTLSENILNGHGYSVLSINGQYTPANWFPPGYPYLLALNKLLVGSDNINGLKIINGLLFLVAILLLFSVVKKLTHSAELAFSVAVLLALNSGVLRFATILMSEISFLLFTVLALFAVLNIDKKTEQPVFWKNYWFYIAVVSTIISFYIRGFGIVLMASITLHWLFQRRWKLASAFLAGNILLFLPYQIRNSIYGLEGRYLKTIFVNNPWRPESGKITSLSEFIDKIITNLNDTVIHGFPQVLFPTLQQVTPGFWIKIFGLIIIVISTYGIWRLKKYRILLGGLIAFNVGIFLLWHTGNGVRYVWPLAGFLYFVFCYGLLELIRHFIPRLAASNSSYLPFVFLIFAIFLFPSIKTEQQRASAPYPPSFRNYFSLAASVSKLPSPENYVVACIKPEIFMYFAHNRATRFKYSLDDKELIQHLVDINADYVVLDQLGYSATGRYLYPAIQKNPHLFQTALQLENPDTYLLLFNKTAAQKMLSSSTQSPQPEEEH